MVSWGTSANSSRQGRQVGFGAVDGTVVDRTCAPAETELIVVLEAEADALDELDVVHHRLEQILQHPAIGAVTVPLDDHPVAVLLTEVAQALERLAHARSRRLSLVAEFGRSSAFVGRPTLEAIVHQVSSRSAVQIDLLCARLRQGAENISGRLSVTTHERRTLPAAGAPR